MVLDIYSGTARCLESEIPLWASWHYMLEFSGCDTRYTLKQRGTKLKFPQDAKEEIRKLADDLMHDSMGDLGVRICNMCIGGRADLQIGLVER